MENAQQDKNECHETHTVLPLTDEKGIGLPASSCKLCQKKDCEILELKNKIAQIEKCLSNYKNDLYSVYVSKSWRYTWLCRKLGSTFRKCFTILYFSVFRKVIKAIYLLLPISIRCSNFVEN